MTLENAIKIIKNKEGLIRSLKEEVTEIENNLISLAPFQIGDRVKVTLNGVGTVCFISAVVYVPYSETCIEYRFKKMTREGNQSKSSCDIYYYDKIEKVD